MNIEYYIDEIIKKFPEKKISRGNIIDHLSNCDDNWVLALKALLIKKNTFYIYIYYLLEKLEFMKNNPNKEHLFLDIQALNIYNALKGYYGD